MLFAINEGGMVIYNAVIVPKNGNTYLIVRNCITLQFISNIYRDKTKADQGIIHNFTKSII